MKSTASIFFAVLLANSVYFTSGAPSVDSILTATYLRMLQSSIDSTGTSQLPFTLNANVIKHLNQTSDGFKSHCVCYYSEYYSASNGSIMAPISALNSTIHDLFHHYKESAGNENYILAEIETVDPIGLNVYLTKNNIDNSSPIFMDFVNKFYETMCDRVRLLNMRTDNSYITIFDENHSRTLHHVPSYIRKQITTEYQSLPSDTLDLFADIVTENLPPGMKMYGLDRDRPVNFDLHTMEDVDDVQFSRSKPYGDVGHSTCTYYKASDKKVYIYDSAEIFDLSRRQLANIRRRYPNNNGLELVTAKSLQGDNPTCGLFAIAYATMLLTGKDPATEEVKLNNVHGDDTLYIRIHLLNMLVNRKFAEFK